MHGGRQLRVAEKALRGLDRQEAVNDDDHHGVRGVNEHFSPGHTDGIADRLGFIVDGAAGSKVQLLPPASLTSRELQKKRTTTGGVGQAAGIIVATPLRIIALGALQ